MKESGHILNPFPGLRSFEPEESHLFFGRERQIHELLVRLDRTKFLAVVGTSGCGKSSLVRAGLLPKMSKGHEGKGGNSWKVLLFKPGDDPFGNLAAAFLGADEVTGEVMENSLHREDLVAGFSKSASGIADTAKEAGLTQSNLVLVVDQFEELFTYHSSEAKEQHGRDATKFVDSLLHIAAQPELPIYVVLTMRTDFLGNCTEFEGLTEVINEGQYLIPRMTRQERKVAILGPIEAGSGKISERLIERLLNDTGDDQDQLPILQHTLMRMWDYWKKKRLDGQPLDYHEYEAVGCIEGALSIHAEEAFEELEGERQKQIAELLFKALTDLGADYRGTRRPTPIHEICQLAEASEEEVIEVVEVFRAGGRAFLMPPSKTRLQSDVIIDISHESLMRKWERLRKWVEEEIKSAQLYVRLCHSSALYQDGKTGLLGNPELQLAMNWQQENNPNVTWANRYNPAYERAINYLEHSSSEYHLAIAKKENRQKRELRRAKRFTIILGIASVISLLFLLIAFNLKFKAEDSEKLALKQSQLAVIEKKKSEDQTKKALAQKKISEQQQEIAYQQRLIAEENREMAVKQTVIAKEQRTIADAQRLEAVKQEEIAVDARDEAVRQEEIALQQKELAEKLRIKAEASEANTKRLRLLAVARNMAVHAATLDRETDAELINLLALQAFHFNKNNLGPEKEPDIYQALSFATEDEILMRGHKDAVKAVAYSPKGDLVVSGSEDGAVKVWQVGKDVGTPLHDFEIVKGTYKGIRSVSVNSTNTWVAAGNYGGEIKVWNLASGKGSGKSVTCHNGPVSQIAFSTDRDMLFSGGTDSSLYVTNVNDAVLTSKLIEKFQGKIKSITLSANGQYLASATEKGQVKIFDLRDNFKAVLTLTAKSANLVSISLNKDGSQLAEGGLDGRIYVWQDVLQGNQAIALPAHNSSVVDLTFSPAKQELVSVSLDGAIKIWDIAHLESEPIAIEGHDNWVWSAAFSNDGKKVVTGGEDKTVRLWSSDASLMIDDVCTGLGRNLTPEEWEKYIGADIPYERTCSNLPAGDTSDKGGNDGQ